MGYWIDCPVRIRLIFGHMMKPDRTIVLADISSIVLLQMGAIVQTELAN
jgi:hypothetical protein